MKRFCLLIISIFLFNILCFAQTKTFTKQGESVVQKDQSVNQVISYLKQKLTREAQEEAGTFVTTNLKIENYQTIKDEFTSFAGSISKTTVLEEAPFMKDKEQYVKVKIKVDIDTDNVKAYLEKIMQDNEYKEKAQKAIKEAEELKKKNLELENKLKTATKQEYEQKLSLQAEQQIQEQKQREIELNKMAVQAKEKYIKAKEEQQQQQAKREQETLNLKQQVAQKKDNIKKTELENQTKIKELEKKAKENQSNWNSNTDKMSIQQAIEEATNVKQETVDIMNNFENLLKENNEQIIKNYVEQVQLSYDTSKRGQWEKEEEYNARLRKNEQIKEKLEQEKEFNILNERNRILKSMITTLNPFINKLIYFQTENFYDKDNTKAELVGIEKIDIDNEYFIMSIKYNKKKYKVKYDFSDIGRNNAQLMYDTQNQFVIEPFFSINDKLKQELMGFDIKHLGMNKEKTIRVKNSIDSFSEIDDFKTTKNILLFSDKKLEIIDLLDEELNFFKKQNFTKFPRDLEKIKTLFLLNKIEKETLQNYLIYLKNRPIAVVGIQDSVDLYLSRDGRVACSIGIGKLYYHNKQYIEDIVDWYNDVLKYWKDIVAICAFYYTPSNYSYVDPNQHLYGNFNRFYRVFVAGMDKRGRILSFDNRKKIFRKKVFGIDADVDNKIDGMEKKEWATKNKNKLPWATDSASSYFAATLDNKNFTFEKGVGRKDTLLDHYNDSTYVEGTDIEVWTRVKIQKKRK